MEKFKKLLSLFNIKQESIDGFLSEEPTVSEVDLRNEVYESMVDQAVQTGHSKVKKLKQSANDNAFTKTMEKNIKAINECLGLEIEIPTEIEKIRDLDIKPPLAEFKTAIDLKLKDGGKDVSKYVEEVNKLKAKNSEYSKLIPDLEKQIEEANGRAEKQLRATRVNNAFNNKFGAFLGEKKVVLSEAKREFFDLLAKKHDVQFDVDDQDNLLFKKSDGTDIYIDQKKPKDENELFDLLMTKGDLYPDGKERTKPTGSGVADGKRDEKVDYSVYDKYAASAKEVGAELPA